MSRRPADDLAACAAMAMLASLDLDVVKRAQRAKLAGLIAAELAS